MYRPSTCTYTNSKGLTQLRSCGEALLLCSTENLERKDSWIFPRAPALPRGAGALGRPRTGDAALLSSAGLTSVVMAGAELLSTQPSPCDPRTLA